LLNRLTEAKNFVPLHRQTYQHFLSAEWSLTWTLQVMWRWS
jgi:hypothetical protein